MKVCFRHVDGATREVAIGPVGMVIGRFGGGADLELDGDTGISRRHGRLWLEAGRVWYEDLGSSNGSWRDGQQLSGPIALAPDHEIVIGRTAFFLLEPTPSALPAQSTDGYEVRLQAEAGAEAFTEILGRGHDHRYLDTLTEMVKELLGSFGPEVLSNVLTRLCQVVPERPRISLVNWPPDDKGSLSYLVSMHAPEGGNAPVSLNLCRRAVGDRQAILFSEKSDPEADEMSAKLKGIRSAVYVPLLTAAGEAMAVLCVDNPNSIQPMEAEAFSFIRAVGGLLATAMAAERLRAEARQREQEARENLARRETLSNFLSIASHDLKTPLTVILGCARLVPLVDDPDKLQLLNEKILRAGERAESLVGSYLEVSELASGAAVELNLEDFDLGALIDAEISFLQQAYPDSSVKLNNEVRGITVRADLQKVQQILSNLISNAVKYSPDGGTVTLTAWPRKERWAISVSDEGVGISQDDQKRLFQQFQRVGNRKLAPGTGLGLWLTHSLVVAHEGRITVESAPGSGSTFTFTLARGSTRLLGQPTESLPDRKKT